MKTQEQIEKMLLQYQAEFKNIKPICEDSASWFKGHQFMQEDDNLIRATAKEYTDLHDRACKFEGAIAVLKIILDEPTNK